MNEFYFEPHGTLQGGLGHSSGLNEHYHISGVTRGDRAPMITHPVPMELSIYLLILVINLL